MSALKLGQQKKNKLILAVLLLTPVLVMIAATLTYKSGYVPATKKNLGMLLAHPQQITELTLQDSKAGLFDYLQSNKDYRRWNLFIFGDGACLDKKCAQQLWLSRQAHVALAHRAHYVSRYYVAVGARPSKALQRKFAKQHPRLKWLYTQDHAYQDFVNKFDMAQFDPLRNHQTVLVDPNGWLMMFYDDNNDGSDIIHDLKYLLKKQGK